MSDYIVHSECIGEGQYHYTIVGELVRCKECKNCLTFDDQTISPGCSIWGRFTSEDTFCSYGERRADDD